MSTPKQMRRDEVIAACAAGAMGGLFLWFAVYIAVQLSQARGVSTGIILLVAFSLAVGAGMLQFAYVILFKKKARIHSSVLGFASVGFMVLGATLLVVSLTTQPKTLAFRLLLAPYGCIAMIGIGILGLRLVRRRKAQNQLPEPTSASGRGSS